MKLLTMQFSPVSFISSLLGLKIFLSTLFQDACIDHKNIVLLLHAAGLNRPRLRYALNLISGRLETQGF